MDSFPVVDPIPLPAPVWLFKVLHTATLVLHFTAVHFLVGGLAVAVFWSLVGRWRNDEAQLNAGGAVARRLPVVMAYVINLGVPPLLFAQVLYGRALYTSSVLIGFWWISVIGLLMFSYFLLYRMARRAENGLGFGWMALIALAVVMKIGFIYSNNMTLMLRPDLWLGMYRNSPLGNQLNTSDPTVMPRWLFMMIGSVGISGVGLMLLGFQARVPESARQLLRNRGGMLLALFTLVQIFLALGVYSAQPEAVRTELYGSSFYLAVAAAWLLTAAGLVVLGLLNMASAARPVVLLPALAGLVAFLNVTLLVLFRDGIRDASLRLNGFDVWARTVNTNWSIVILFLVLFVVALGFVGWMAAVTFRSKGEDEQYA